MDIFESGYMSGTLNSNKEKLYKKWGKALKLPASDPFHRSLQSHEIDALSQRYGKK